MLDIKKVSARHDWRRFIGLPWTIYRDYPHWVPPLRVAVREALDTRRNPFYRHAELLPLLAVRNGAVVGRIAGIIDQAHNRYHGERTGFFGFFEAVDDQSVCDALLGELASWCRERGMERLRGPVNPSTNHECGLLIDAFDLSPRIMMPYNPPYYAELLSGWGLDKVKDLTAWDIHAETPFSERVVRVAERQRQSAGITVRELDMKAFDHELGIILDIYNQAWGRNWGFVPMDETEFRHMAGEMKPIVDPRLCLIASVKGEPAAFGLSLPNINQALKRIPDGRLFPFGLAKLLWYVRGPGRRSCINEQRILTLGVKQQYRALGLGGRLYTEYVKRAPGLGLPTGEASWILEDNKDMVRSLAAFNATLTRRYRIYEKAL